MTTEKFKRNTPQRQVILDELKGLRSHPTASDLYEIVRKRLPKISLGTVYRNLELLREMGQVTKLESSGSEARFDGNLEPHFHIRCVDCGRIDDIYEPLPEIMDALPEDRIGYKVCGFQLEYLGLCPDCRQKDGPPKRSVTGT